MVQSCQQCMERLPPVTWTRVAVKLTAPTPVPSRLPTLTLLSEMREGEAGGVLVGCDRAVDDRAGDRDVGGADVEAAVDGLGVDDGVGGGDGARPGVDGQGSPGRHTRIRRIRKPTNRRRSARPARAAVGSPGPWDCSIGRPASSRSHVGGPRWRLERLAATPTDVTASTPQASHQRQRGARALV